LQPYYQIFQDEIMPLDCPKCVKTLTRLRRKPWMRRIPGSKRYECRRCGYDYLLIFNRWLLKRRQIP
jgi:transposase-like protein